MTCTTHARDFAPGHPRAPEAAPGKLRFSLRRLTGAFAARRQRRVDRQIAGILAISGERLTDSMEREIMRRVLGSDWSRLP
jgi:hypothetical protein